MAESAFKVLVLGMSNVGKTSIVRRLHENAWSDSPPGGLTTSYDVATHTIIRDGKSVVLKLWDTAGQERYRGALTSTFYRNTHAVCLVCASNETESGEQLKEWFEQCSRYCVGRTAPLYMIIRNKTDLDASDVTLEYVTELASGWDECEVVDTSAKSGAGVAAAFDGLVDRLIARNPDMFGGDEAMGDKREGVVKVSGASGGTGGRRRCLLY